MQKVTFNDTREKFVVETTKRGNDSPATIRAIMKAEGIQDMTEQAILIVQQKFGLKKKSTVKGRPKKLNN